MTDIEITVKENIDGITISLALSTSFEALTREVQDVLRQERFFGIPYDLKERLLSEVRLEVNRSFESLRSRLRSGLISLFTKYFKEQMD